MIKNSSRTANTPSNPPKDNGCRRLDRAHFFTSPCPRRGRLDHYRAGRGSTPRVTSNFERCTFLCHPERSEGSRARKRTSNRHRDRLRSPRRSQSVTSWPESACRTRILHREPASDETTFVPLGLARLQNGSA